MGDPAARTSPSVDDVVDMALLKVRRIFISEPIDNESANAAIRKLWYLELQDPGEPILLVINSPGGSVDSGFAIWDQIHMITSPVTTLVTGLAASMGSVLSIAAARGKRFATPFARIMVHQPSIHGVVQGQATDLEIQALEMLKTHNMLIELYMERTGQDRKSVEKALDRDTWMTAGEAKEFGLLDDIVSSFQAIGF